MRTEQQKPQEFTVSNIAELRAFAVEIVETLTKSARKENGGATVVALSGELGAGKTAFAQEIARLLGVGVPVASPTFVIEKIYALSGAPWKRLVHIDAYRLENTEELMRLGYDDLAHDPDNLILIEWPERVASALPKEYVQITFRVAGEEKRIVHFTFCA